VGSWVEERIQLRTTWSQEGLFKSRTDLGCQVVKRETSDRTVKKGLERKSCTVYSKRRTLLT
jgi:hypothetical protein